MGKAKGRARQSRRLVDMTTEPQAYTYEAPPREECEANHWTTPLSEEGGHRLEVQAWMQRGKVVDFAIMQIARVNSEDKHVARIDCCHGTVHRHVLEWSGNDIAPRQVIQAIPEQRAADVIDREFGLALDRFEGEWRENVRQWERG